MSGWIPHYTEECYYDSNNELICNTIYVNDGYWQKVIVPRVGGLVLLNPAVRKSTKNVILIRFY